MPPQWTAAQKAAINIHGCDILVSAAAGSGKTAALTERIICALTREENPADITRILAVTFTRASAADLRRKLRDALSAKLAAEPGNRRLIRQMMLLGSAKICTIDAFYNDIIKAHFQRLNLPAGFRIADEAELKILGLSIMEAHIDRSYACDPNFPAIADIFADNKDDAPLAELFIGMYETIRKYPEGIEFLKCGAATLREEAEIDFFRTRAGDFIAGELAGKLTYFLKVLNTAYELVADDTALFKSTIPPVEQDIEHINSLLDAIDGRDYKGARQISSSYSPKNFGRLSPEQKTDEILAFREQRGTIRKFLSGIFAAYFKREHTVIPSVFVRTADVSLALYNFLSQFENELRDEKLSRGICDFEDIRHYTLELLVKNGEPTDIARGYASRFDEILIDEYQDVDLVQDKIFSALTGCASRFMVGDIKQSIYGFRGAEPSLFSGRRASYRTWNEEDGYSPPKEGGGVTVFMSNNFRCDKNIVKFVNTVCPPLFTACGSSIGYVPQDDLIFSKTVSDGYVSPKVSFTLICPPPRTGKSGEADEKGGNPPAEKISDTAAAADDFSDSDSDRDGAADIDAPEIRFIGAKISELLRQGRRADGEIIKPSDIAVLCRTKSVCADISDALSQLGIPTVSDSRRKYFDDPAVSLMISLLTVIDNPQKDIPLAAALRSPLFGFTMEDLARIRRGSNPSSSLIDALTEYADAGTDDLADKCRSFSAVLSAYRTLARSLPADRLMRHIMNDTNVLSLAGGNGDAGRGRLLALYEYARQFEAGSFRGLYNFIKYVNNSIDSDTSPGGEGAAADTNAVAVMTIHHSKGLEFPVCFVAGCAKKFRRVNTDSKTRKKNPFMPDRRVGPAILLRDPTGLAQINNQLVQAAELNMTRSELEEEMRLLYVAMTRARERLYLSARYPYSKDNLLCKASFGARFLSSDPQPVLAARSYLEWLLLTLPQPPHPDAPYSVNMLEDDEIEQPEPYLPPQTDIPEECPAQSSADDIAARLRECFSFSYPYRHSTQIPAKLSISRLYPGVLDDEDGSTAPYTPSDVIPELTPAPPIPQTLNDDELLPPSATPFFIAGGQRQQGGRDAGIATHVFLQFCDFTRFENHGFENETALLCEKRFMSRDMADLIDRRQIELFFRSELYSSIRNAIWLRREQRFNIMLPAANFTKDPAFAAELADEELLIQGVIDLFFEDADGRLVLCDYKTDRLTPQELADKSLAAKTLAARHRTQLSYYAAALRRICGRAPDNILIYSLPLGDSVSVTVDVIN